MWTINALIVFGVLCTRLQLIAAQNNCYFGAGAGFRGPSNLVPCNTTGSASACCLLGDTCLTGNACYNYATGNTYQYGCTDINYEDESCPKKCGFDPGRSPWIGLEYCSDIQDLTNNWACEAPESCGCEWNSSYALQILPSRACGAMGSEARVALYAPSTLMAYVSLPPTAGGSTGYYSATTDSDGSLSMISTAIAGYTPDYFTQPTQYRKVPDGTNYINPGATASPSTESPAYIYTDSTPIAAPVAPTSSIATSSVPLSTSVLLTSSASKTTPLVSTTPTHTKAAAGLTTGAKIGIGVGVAGGVLFLAAIGICWFLLARRRSKKNAAEVHPPPQFAQSPAMGQFVPGQQPSGWAPFPNNGMPYYVVPASSILQQKDAPSMTTSPAYSPPHSPPPPTELSTDHGQRPIPGSPRLASMTSSETAGARYA